MTSSRSLGRRRGLVGLFLLLCVGASVVVAVRAFVDGEPGAPRAAAGNEHPGDRERAPAPVPERVPDMRSAPSDRAAQDELPAQTAVRAELVVRVADEHGGPIAGIGVLVEHGRPGRAVATRRATTDAGGLAIAADLPVGEHRVHVRGARSRTVTLQPGDSLELRFVLRRGVGIDGLVLDAFDQPVADATIWAMPGSRLDPDRAAPAGRTAFDGSFHLVGFELPVRTWVAARADGHGASPWGQVAADDPAALRGLTLHLRAERGVLRGICRDVDGGVMAGVEVRVAPLGVAEERDGTTRLWPGHEFDTRSDDDGRVAFDDLAPGRWIATARADGCWFEPVEAQVRGGLAVTTIELLAERAAFVRASVTDAVGDPLAGAFVRAQQVPSARATADEAGRLTLYELPPRTIVLRAFLDGYEDSDTECALVPGPNDVTLVMGEAAAFVGTLHDAAGEALVDWQVSAVPDGSAGGAAGGARTTADGSFSFDVDERVPHGFRVAPPGVRFLMPLDDAGLHVPGPAPVALVVSDAARPSGAIVGRLPEPVEGSRYALSLRGTASGVNAQYGEARLERPGAVAGAFRLAPLPPGSYELFVASRRIGASTPEHGLLGVHRFGPFELAVAQELDVGLLVLPESGRLEYALTVPQGGEPKNVRLQWYAVGSESWGIVPIEPREPGSCAMVPGDYDVTIWGEGFLSIERRVTVVAPPAPATRLEAVLVPGQRLPLELALPDGETSARFVVRDANGRVAYEDEFGESEARTVRRLPVLGLGRHTVEVTGGSGARYAGEFVVASLEPTKQALRPQLQVR